MQCVRDWKNAPVRAPSRLKFEFNADYTARDGLKVRLFILLPAAVFGSPVCHFRYQLNSQGFTSSQPHNLTEASHCISLQGRAAYGARYFQPIPP